MYQDITWCEGRPQPRQHCVRWDPARPPLMGTIPNFRPMSVVTKGLHTKMSPGMEVGRGPVFDVDPAPSPLREQGTARTQFLALVYGGQTAGWMKKPLGTEVDLSPGHIVLDGDPVPL